MATSMWLSRPSVTSRPVEEARRDGADRLVHRLVVVGGRDDEVAIGDEVVLADAVVMDQRAARRLDDADPFAARRALVGHQVRADDVGVVEQLARQLGRVQHLDHARPMIEQGAVQRLAAAERDELAPLLLRLRRRQEVADLHARQRPDAIPALFRAERLDVRELHVAPGLDLLAQDLRVGRIVDRDRRSVPPSASRARKAP